MRSEYGRTAESRNARSKVIIGTNASLEEETLQDFVKTSRRFISKKKSLIKSRRAAFRNEAYFTLSYH